MRGADIMPTISVIVPVYKVEPYLRQCVDSILSQSFRDFELILVDDGSPDNCPKICDEYAMRDCRIKVLHKENGGVASARNAGFKAANGTYISFIDPDDWVKPEFLDEMLKSLQRENADMVLCGTVRFLKDGSVTEEIRPNRQSYELDKIQVLMTYGYWYYAVLWNKLYRHEVFDGVHFPESYIHEDEAVLHRIIANSRKITMIPQVLYVYRQSDDSIMRREFNINRTDMLTALADRIVFSYQQSWIDVYSVTSKKYAEMFFDYYFRFPRTAENEKYFRRMEDSLKTALPFILKSKTVSLRHKIYLSIIRFNPRLYTTLRRFKG